MVGIFLTVLGLTLPPELKNSEISEKYDLKDARYANDFSYWVKQIDRSETAAKTLTAYSDAPTPTSLGRVRRIASPNGRLFVAKVKKKDGSEEVEFLSWNETTKKNDFGAIKNFGTADAKIQMADRMQCLECHKTSSAIFMKGPWITSTGSNGPTSALIGFGILHHLAIENPDKYKKYVQYFLEDKKRLRSDFGDLPKEISDFLKPVEIEGIPVFDFKGAEPLDENVVRNYLLTLTYEIHRKLDEPNKKRFAEEITRGALLGFVKGQEIEYSWNWFPFLKRYFQNELRGQTVLGGVGPLRSNYFPPFENVPIIRKLFYPISSYGPGALENLMEADKFIEESDIDLFPSEASARNIKVFEPLVSRFRSDTAKETLRNLFDLSEADLKSLKEAAPEISDSAEWKELFNSGEIPTGKQILEWAKTSISPEARRPENATAHRCLSCHDGSGAAQKMPFDPLKPQLWEERLRSDISETERKALLKWITKIPSRLLKPTGDSLKMPPEDSDQGKGFDIHASAFKAYLDAARAFEAMRPRN